MRKVFRRLSRALLYILAALLILEEWLWEHLRAGLAFVFELLPLERLKAACKNFILNLSPLQSLALFVIPLIALLPLKFFGLWLFARGHWFWAVGNVVAAKLLGTAITAVILELTKPKLLEMTWFKSLYELITEWLRWAHALLRPFREILSRAIRRSRAMFSGGRSAEVLRRFKRRARRRIFRR